MTIQAGESFRRAGPREADHKPGRFFGPDGTTGSGPGTPELAAYRRSRRLARQDAAARLWTDHPPSAARNGFGAAADINARLAGLRPLLRALVGIAIDLDFDLVAKRALARVDPAAFDTTIIHLVSDACNARTCRIVLRSRVVGARVWILICDNGRGPSGPTVAEHELARGVDLVCAQRFARASHGHLLARSGTSDRTSLALILPTVLSLTARERPAPHRSFQVEPKEIIHDQDRQPTPA